MAPARAHAARAGPSARRLVLRALRALAIAEPGAAEHPSVVRVRAHAAAHGLDLQVKRFAAPTRTAEDAAREIGTTIERIVKSLVFDAAGESVLVLCSGAARVDTERPAAALDVPFVRRATAQEAKRASGFAIGGVPPFGHRGPLKVLLDEGLLQFDEVWAASGLPDSVFPIDPRDLLRVSGATVVKVAA